MNNDDDQTVRFSQRQSAGPGLVMETGLFCAGAALLQMYSWRRPRKQLGGRCCRGLPRSQLQNGPMLPFQMRGGEHGAGGRRSAGHRGQRAVLRGWLSPAKGGNIRMLWQQRA